MPVSLGLTSIDLSYASSLRLRQKLGAPEGEE
jgi:hypothetical protein